ncbi:autotransporter outer membrane beta-barrel domain-containing protein, partial [Escherichia alba]|nr:autotransporter outer membrane beta-barrel domain-containing protein [Intestinirhabdus alba]
MDLKLHNRVSQGTETDKFKKAFRRRGLAHAGLLSLSGSIFLPQAQAADIGSQSGANIAVNDNVRIVADKGETSASLYGVLNPFGETGTIDLGNNVTVIASDPTLYAKGVEIKGAGSVLTANGLTVEAYGKNAIGLNIFGQNAYADLGTGSRIKVVSTAGSMTAGVVIDTASTLVADRLSIETIGDSGTGLTISDYGSSADLGSGSTVKTNGRGSHGVYVDGLNGTAANGPARFIATALSIDTQGDDALGINVQNNAIVDLGSGSLIKTSGADAHGIWSFGEVTAQALTVKTTGNSANGIEVREGTADIGADSHISAARGGGLVANGQNTTLNYFGTVDKRNTVFSGGSYGASAQFTGATVNLKNSDITVDRNGSLALGLWALGGGVITGEDLTITGAAGSRGVYAVTGSRIDLTGDLAINMADTTQMAIGTQHNDGYAASRINA